MKPVIFWLPLNGIEQEIILPPEYVESTMLPAVEHEAGHIVAAHHFGARVLGISVGFIPEQNQRGMFFQAIYAWKDWSVETECIVKAAGPAADLLYQGKLDEKAVSMDLQDIRELSGIASLEPYLSLAKSVFEQYPDEFKCVVSALRKSIDSDEERTLGRLPNGRIGALLLDEAELMQCLGNSKETPC